MCIKMLENYGTLYIDEGLMFIFVDLKVLVSRKPEGVIPWSTYVPCESAEMQNQPLFTSHQN